MRCRSRRRVWRGSYCAMGAVGWGWNRDMSHLSNDGIRLITNRLFFPSVINYIKWFVEARTSRHRQFRLFTTKSGAANEKGDEEETMSLPYRVETDGSAQILILINFDDFDFEFEFLYYNDSNGLCPK